MEGILNSDGRPCLWEKGGGSTNTGEAVLIAASDGSPKQALDFGHCSNENHALIPLGSDDLIIEAFHHRGSFEISIWRIHTIILLGDGTPDIQTELIAKFEQGVWNCQLPSELEDVVQAVKAKATDYHCRRHYWVVK